MNITKENFEEVRELLNELERLETALDVLMNHTGYVRFAFEVDNEEIVMPISDTVIVEYLEESLTCSIAEIKLKLGILL